MHTHTHVHAHTHMRMHTHAHAHTHTHTPDFLGSIKLAIKQLLRDGDSPWTKRLLLEDVSNGEIELKIELELNKSDLLL